MVISSEAFPPCRVPFPPWSEVMRMFSCARGMLKGGVNLVVFGHGNTSYVKHNQSDKMTHENWFLGR